MDQHSFSSLSVNEKVSRVVQSANFELSKLAFLGLLCLSGRECDGVMGTFLTAEVRAVFEFFHGGQRRRRSCYRSRVGSRPLFGKCAVVIMTTTNLAIITTIRLEYAYGNSRGHGSQEYFAARTTREF
jgi:hypothetical protein